MYTLITQVAEIFKKADRILFITGAGLSADSGLPTYRGIGGLYDDKHTDEGIPIEEALSGDMLKRHPEITWKYLWQIGSACSGKKFNRGHEVIALIEKMKSETWVLTQNIDGFHRDAGSKNLIEVHGNASELYCTKCSFKSSSQNFLSGYGTAIQIPPKCPECKGLIRPNVVLFGEMLPEKALKQIYEIETIRMDAVLSVGTSGVFPYISGPVIMARQAGVPTVEINPCDTGLSDMVDFKIKAGAAETLDRIWKEMNKA
ncbi:MAG TPA: NAD-dependent protein deacylase [Lentisphaeria bacterium]|nr:MAG: NAD-dependent protein deacylase [Lentisphaerae bacterium GWF2_50_93]HCE45975.1 NAD-dependent protein deacylase [Lentisphaeria bacterium]